MIRQRLKKRSGFTLIELVIVILMISVMGTIIVYQYIDMRNEARKSKLRERLGTIRVAIKNQRAQMILRCGGDNTSWPSLDSLQNNFLSNTDCPPSSLISNNERKFVDEENIPANPIITDPGNDLITACDGNGCIDQCNPAGCNDIAVSGGWCYDPTTGSFWADSRFYDGSSELECSL